MTGEAVACIQPSSCFQRLRLPLHRILERLGRVRRIMKIRVYGWKRDRNEYHDCKGQALEAGESSHKYPRHEYFVIESALPEGVALFLKLGLRNSTFRRRQNQGSIFREHARRIEWLRRFPRPHALSNIFPADLGLQLALIHVEQNHVT